MFQSHRVLFHPLHVPACHCLLNRFKPCLLWISGCSIKATQTLMCLLLTRPAQREESPVWSRQSASVSRYRAREHGLLPLPLVAPAQGQVLGPMTPPSPAQQELAGGRGRGQEPANSPGWAEAEGPVGGSHGGRVAVTPAGEWSRRTERDGRPFRPVPDQNGGCWRPAALAGEDAAPGWARDT